MRILIIGGTGNISTAIVNELLKVADNEVILLNRGSRQVSGVQTIVCDRNNHAAFERTVEQLGHFDCVFDMVGFTPQDAHSAVRAFAQKTQQFVFCSTVDVYQKPAPSYPITEDAPRQADKRFIYAYHKLQMERILEQAAQSGVFELTIVRPAATYHDRSEPLGILDSGFAVLRRMREGKPVIVMGDAMNLWTFSHRDDVGQAIAHCAGNPSTFGAAYNVCADKAIPWISYYRALADALHVSDAAFISVPTDMLYAAFPQQCALCEYNFKFNNVFDNTAAKRDLGYQTTVDWPEGAKRIVKHALDSGSLGTAADTEGYDELVNRFTAFYQEIAH